jgi:hypothetical protein
MGKEPDQPTEEPTGPAEEPPPFQPDPELISYLERGGKPSEREVREMTEKAQRRPASP